MAEDLLIGLALVFVIEGIMYALFPAGAKRMAAEVIGIPEGTLRIVGIAAMLIGVVLVWLLRG